MHSAVRSNQFLSPFQRLHVLHLQTTPEVIFVGEVPCWPQHAACYGLRLGFRSKFDFPFRAVFITYLKLRAGTFEIFFAKCVPCMGLMSLSSRTVKQIAGSDVARVRP